jgi:hypothetical protein
MHGETIKILQGIFPPQNAQPTFFSKGEGQISYVRGALTKKHTIFQLKPKFKE